MPDTLESLETELAAYWALGRETIFSHTEPGQYPVELVKRNNGTFDVHYGYEHGFELSWEDAARKLGFCIMHALQCNGKTDIGD